MTDERVLLAATNLRDLGGYATGDGRVVRTGLLLRGGHMAELDDAGHAIYEGLGLRSIVDLRRTDEIADRPTPRFGDERNVHVAVSEGDRTFAQMAGLIDDPAAAGRIVDRAAGYYARLVTDNLDRFRPVFDVVMDPAHLPTLFHCTAGKDRTGFTAAAILKFLDVDDETVFADYVLSASVRAPYVERRAAEVRARMADERGVGIDEIPDAELDPFRALLSADPRMLEATFASVDDRFGGDWHVLRRDGLGIDDDRLAAFRAAVLK